MWLLLAIGAAVFAVTFGIILLTVWLMRRRSTNSSGRKSPWRTPPLMRGLPFSERRAIMQSIRRCEVSPDAERRLIQTDLASWIVASRSMRLIGVAAAPLTAVRAISDGGGRRVFGIALLLAVGIAVFYSFRLTRQAENWLERARLETQPDPHRTSGPAPT